MTLLVDAALLEYSLDLDLPNSVFDDPVFIEVDKAAVDIMAWQNVCGFKLNDLPSLTRYRVQIRTCVPLTYVLVIEFLINLIEFQK